MNHITGNIVIDNVSEYMFADYGNGTAGPDDEKIYICNNESNQLHLFHTVFQPLVYGVVFLLGMIGNGLLLTVLLKRRSNLRITEIYLLHLALADLLLLFTLPFAVTEGVAGWLFGNFLCKLLGLVNRLNLVCGSLLLACIGFDRYLAIVHAIPSLQTRRPRTVHLTCALLWLLCLFVTIPDTVFLSVEKVNSSRLFCSYHNHGIHANNWLLTSRFITHLLCFFLPLVIMGYCYTTVIITLCQSQKSLEKQRAIRLALLVTLVFCLCWLPYNIVIFINTLKELGAVPETCHTRETLKQAIIVTESIGFSHCCLNPILYAFIGVRFRRDLVQLLKKIKCLRVCLSGQRTKNLNRVSVAEAVSTTTSSQYI